MITVRQATDPQTGLTFKLTRAHDGPYKIECDFGLRKGLKTCAVLKYKPTVFQRIKHAILRMFR